jgi:dTDP-4-amino-4,6-dideoxygalactose transaminase
VVEDACQAGGAEINGSKLGSIAHVTAFSFSGKTLSHLGNGGFFSTNDRKLYERALLAGQHGVAISPKIQSEELRRYLDFSGRGDNLRFPPMLRPGILRDLESADARIEWRRRNAQFLTSQLKGTPGISPPHVKKTYKHVYHMYTCLFDEREVGISRDLFLRALRAEGIPAIAYVSHANFYFVEGGEAVISPPMYRRSFFKDMDYYGKGCPFKCPYGVQPNYADLSLPVTERIHDQEFSLVQSTLSAPNGLGEMQLIVDAIKKVLAHSDELQNAHPDSLKQEEIFRY